jgi:hypothetical protein
VKVIRILLPILVVLACHPSYGQESTVKTDRERAGLLGPVAKIKVESTYFKREEDKWVESERALREESEYDVTGKVVSQKRVPAFGAPAPCRSQYRYDDKKRETERFCSDSTRETISEKYSYEEDSFGNWIKRVASVPDGATFRPQWTLYRTITYFE